MTPEEKIAFFNENFNVFETELEKRRRKWQLRAVPSLDFSDIKQTILFHIFKKLHLYDPTKSPLSHWTNSVISSQLSNLLRNNYYNFVKPCVRCSCAIGDTGCELYSEQGNKCIVYKIWESSKKNAFDIQLALPICNHEVEIFDIPNTHSDMAKQISDMHFHMKKCLKSFEYKIYHCLYILGLSEMDTAKKLGYKSKEKFKYEGYASIAKAKKVIIIKAKELIENGEIDIL